MTLDANSTTMRQAYGARINRRYLMIVSVTAVLALMQYVASEDQIARIVFWMMGSLSRASWEKISLGALLLALAIPFSLLRTWPMTALRMTVFESVLLALKQTTGWRVQQDNLDRVSGTLKTLGLSHVADRGIADLSGGQAQMVAVAQTIVRAPDVILLDEPTSALYLHHQLPIMTSIKNELDEKQPVVMAALHDLNLAAKFCDRLVLLRQGHVLADGQPEDILGLAEIGETYRVETRLEKTSKGGLYVDAALSAT